jgi:hypothetical protein
MNILKNRHSGQSLVEVVVATGVITVIVTGLVVAAITSLKASQSSRARSIATKLTQDGMESMRNIRDNGWQTFISYSDGEAWCFPITNVLQGHGSTCTNNITIGTVRFTRTVLVTSQAGPPESADVTISVTWNESGITRTSQAKSMFTQWR